MITNHLYWNDKKELQGQILVKVPEKVAVRFAHEEIEEAIENNDISEHIEDDGITISAKEDTRYSDSIGIYLVDFLNPEIEFEETYKTQYQVADEFDINKDVKITLAEEDRYLPFTLTMAEDAPERKK